MVSSLVIFLRTVLEVWLGLGVGSNPPLPVPPSGTGLRVALLHGGETIGAGSAVLMACIQACAPPRGAHHRRPHGRGAPPNPNGHNVLPGMCCVLLPPPSR